MFPLKVMDLTDLKDVYIFCHGPFKKIRSLISSSCNVRVTLKRYEPKLNSTNKLYCWYPNNEFSWKSIQFHFWGFHGDVWSRGLLGCEIHATASMSIFTLKTGGGSSMELQTVRIPQQYTVVKTSKLTILVLIKLFIMLHLVKITYYLQISIEKMALIGNEFWNKIKDKCHTYLEVNSSLEGEISFVAWKD